MLQFWDLRRPYVKNSKKSLSDIETVRPPAEGSHTYEWHDEHWYSKLKIT